MPSLYVTEPGAVVRKSGESFLVTLDEDPDGKGPLPEKRRIIIEVEVHRVETIALVGRVHISSDAVMYCLELGICVAWFAWNGDFRGRLVPESPKSGDLRLMQYEAVHDLEKRFVRARAVVNAKLTNAAKVLEDVQSNEPGVKTLSSAIMSLKNSAEKNLLIEKPEQLLGIEGSGARKYFDALSLAFKKDIRFTGRAKRPPPDPANALLSFGYTLLGNLIGGVIEARGLDPALGFFHEIRPGRPSLALDLLEELRHPVVDRFVVRSCNLRILRPDMFEPDVERGGVRLTRDGSKVFFREWEKHLLKPMSERDTKKQTDTKSIIIRQVDRLAADFRGGDAYRPFIYGD